MSEPGQTPMVLTREKAIDALRRHLLRMTDDEHSICQVAAKRGLFCRGFTRWGEKQLRQRFHNLEERRPGMSRQELEEMGNTWQLARQIVDRLPLACDVQTVEHGNCLGWDEFSNEELARFLREEFGWDATVTP